MSKMGDRVARRVLYMCALVGIRHNPALRAYYKKRRDAGMAKKAALGACMRKLVHILYAVLKTGKPWEPDYERRFGGSTLATEPEAPAADATAPTETATAEQRPDADPSTPTAATNSQVGQQLPTPHRAQTKIPLQNHVNSP